MSKEGPTVHSISTSKKSSEARQKMYLFSYSGGNHLKETTSAEGSEEVTGDRIEGEPEYKQCSESSQQQFTAGHEREKDPDC